MIILYEDIWQLHIFLKRYRKCTPRVDFRANSLRARVYSPSISNSNRFLYIGESMKNIIKIIFFIMLTCIVIISGTTINNYFLTPEIVDDYIKQGSIKYKFDDLPNEYQDILIKVQDPGFYSHRGVDFKTPGAGWTTITQSLAKFFYFKDFKAGWRKIPQTIYARFSLNPNLSKEKQLDLFINIIGFGNGKKGILAASHFYYGKKPEELLKDEFISLIGLINNPKMLNPKNNLEANKERVRKIKKYLNGEYIPKNIFDNKYEDA